MALPVIAAVAGRVAATGASSAVATGAKTAASSSMKQSAMKSRLLKSRVQTQATKSIQSQPINQSAGAVNQTQSFKQIMAMARSSAQKSGSEETNEQTNEEQELAQAAAKKVMPRAIAFLANQIAATFELGTAGTAFVVTWIIRLLTLGWLNVEMIYGRWIAKGKSKAIPPVAWAPIPMPLDTEAKFLQVGIIMADIFCLIMLILPFVFPIILLAAIGTAIGGIF
jgi:hypothetical protein